MYTDHIPTLRIGNLEITPPIIQGGMGVRVSKANLASAVADTGCAGVIASVGLGHFEDLPGSQFVKVNEEALRYEIRQAKKQSDGIIGVNILVALSNYENLVQASIDEDIDLIISGAGLPLDLPKYLDGKDIKLIPVVSSGRTFKIICRRWKNRFDKIPDAVIVEGVKAGGHLGYSYDSVANENGPKLEETVKEVIDVVDSVAPGVPVIAAGGIFDGADIARFLKLGASGVQMATRFVCTDECDAHDNFKQAYLDVGPDDLRIIQSPVGLPGRVINNSFVEKIKAGETMPFTCNYRCLKTCDPKKAPYCIAKVLTNAAQGKLEESFAFAGSNAYLCDEIISVKALVDKLSEELCLALATDQDVPA